MFKNCFENFNLLFNDTKNDFLLKLQRNQMKSTTNSINNSKNTQLWLKNWFENFNLLFNDIKMIFDWNYNEI